MRLKVGYRFKSIEGPCKGEWFTVIKLDAQFVTYKKVGGNIDYIVPRKHFERMIERVNRHWNSTNKVYKNKKQEMRGE